MRNKVIKMFLVIMIMDYKKTISNECKLRGYSKKTIKSYVYHVGKFLESKKSAKEYLLYLIKNKSDETVRSAGFAIKFYFRILKFYEILSRTTHNICHFFFFFIKFDCYF